MNLFEIIIPANDAARTVLKGIVQALDRLEAIEARLLELETRAAESHELLKAVATWIGIN